MMTAFVYHLHQHVLPIARWQDVLEIGLLAMLMYLMLCWFAGDEQKNLLGWLYGYCGLYAFSWFCNLTTLHFMLVASIPFAACIFCLAHQKNLQKNFITVAKLQPNTLSIGNWIEDIMQSCLQSVNAHHEIMYIIERHDSLSDFLQAPYVIDSPVQQNLLKLLITIHQQPAQPVVVWLNQQGFLYTCNPTWTIKEDAFWLSSAAQQLSPWIQKMLLITEKTDALVLSMSPITRMCTVIIGDKLVQNLSPHQAFQLIKKYCYLTDNKGDAYDHSVIKKTVHQKQTST